MDIKEYNDIYRLFCRNRGGARHWLELAGHECLGFCEYDKFATASYTAMHLCTDAQLTYIKSLPKRQRYKEILKPEYRNGEWYAQDVRKLRASDVPAADCWVFGSPCQSFSLAGKRQGMDGESGLIREIFRLLDERQEQDRPKWIIYENVKGMLSSTRGLDFLSILSEMDRLGYDVCWNNLNSKDFGVPQNRPRIYTVGHLRRFGGYRHQTLSVSGDAESNNRVRQVGNWAPTKYRSNLNQGRVYDDTGLAPCLSACGGGNREPSVIKKCFVDLSNGTGFVETKNSRCISGRYDRGVSNRKAENSGVLERVPKLRVREATKLGFDISQIGDSINLECIGSKTRRGMVGHEVAQTLTTSCNQAVPEICFNESEIRGNGVASIVLHDEKTVGAIWYETWKCFVVVRKLTPRECFRLQGWTDDYFEKAAIVNSDSQLYKQAGNGITVTVMAAVGNAINQFLKKVVKSVAI